MSKLFIILFLSFFYFSTMRGLCQDPIIFYINLAQYKKVAKEKLSNIIADKNSNLYGKYSEEKLNVFSIPAFEWNQKAKNFSCESRESLENMLLFVENPYLQMIVFTDERSNIVENQNLTFSEIRLERRARDSIDWIMQIPDVPFSYLESNPFLYYDIRQLQSIYKYHLKNPDAFIFRIVDFEGFWVIKDNRIYKLEGSSLKNANQHLYIYGDEYIRDIANGTFRTGHPYIGCLSRKEIRNLRIQNSSISVRIIN